MLKPDVSTLQLLTYLRYNWATGATFSGLPAGVTGTWASNVVTISGTPTASGTFNYTVTLTGGGTALERQVLLLLMLKPDVSILQHYYLNCATGSSAGSRWG